MGRYKEWSRRKKGVAGIIAATFLFAMIFTTGFAYFMFIQYNYQLQHQAAIERNQMDFEQNLEQFVVGGSVSNNKLYARVNNTGPVAITIVQVFFFNADTGEFIDGKAISGVTINPGATVTIESCGIPYSSGNRLIKVVTAKGNTGSGMYPPPKVGITIREVESEIAQGLGAIRLHFGEMTVIYPGASNQGTPAVEQTGYSVVSGPGYPAFALSTDPQPAKQTAAVFNVTVTNKEPNGRDIYLNKQSLLTFMTTSPSLNKEWYIIKSYNNSTRTITPLSGSDTIVLPFNVTTFILFGASAAGGSTIQKIPGDVQKFVPGIFLMLFGYYEDYTPYAQTIPFQAAIVTNVKPESLGGAAKLSSYNGSKGDQITVYGSGFERNSELTIGWVNPDDTVQYVHASTYKTDDSGNIPPNTKFIVPDVPAGRYAVFVTDGVNTVFFTFRKT